MTNGKSVIQESGIYIILGFEELCKLCRRMSGDNLFLATNLYYDLSGKYILTVEQGKKSPSYISAKNAVISKLPEYFSEYGLTGKLNERFVAYINEHCKKIASGNAVELMSAV